MKIRLLDKESIREIQQLTYVLNEAFTDRSTYSSINPYTKISEVHLREFVNDPNTYVYIMTEEEAIIASVCCTYVVKKEIKIGEISKVSVLPKYQGKGIARELLVFVHDQAEKKGCSFMELSVGSMWEGAIHLYESIGYKPISVAAHIPGTYKLIKMMKPFSVYNYSDINRYFKLFISECKFELLYQKDSTPNWLCRLICPKRS